MMLFRKRANDAVDVYLRLFRLDSDWYNNILMIERGHENGRKSI